MTHEHSDSQKFDCNKYLKGTTLQTWLDWTKIIEVFLPRYWRNDALILYFLFFLFLQEEWSRDRGPGVANALEYLLRGPSHQFYPCWRHQHRQGCIWFQRRGSLYRGRLPVPVCEVSPLGPSRHSWSLQQPPCLRIIKPSGGHWQGYERETHTDYDWILQKLFQL